MVEIGYAISAEEHHPSDIVNYARLAEESGFTFALISDHYHPWVNQQGHSPFVWSVIGGIATATEKLRLGTGVTCPILRIHPAIIAQAAATSAAMMEGRFFLGIGTGENLNEHILGQRWPAVDVRLEMLEEAIDVMRLLWQGGEQSHYGKYYTVENARIYTLPKQIPEIMIAAGGEKSATLAGKLGDGFINTAPDKKVIQTFEQGGRAGRPKYGKVTICWAQSESEGVKTAYKWWPTAGLTGELNQELPTPAHFEQATELVTEDMIAENISCGPNAQKHLEAIQKYIDAGFDHVYIHQVGPDQEGFMRFCAQNILPEFQRTAVR